jgi:malic enzyme
VGALGALLLYAHRATPISAEMHRSAPPTISAASVSDSPEEAALAGAVEEAEEVVPEPDEVLETEEVEVAEEKEEVEDDVAMAVENVVVVVVVGHSVSKLS